MLPRYRDRAESQTSVWESPFEASSDSSDSPYDEFPEADSAVITDLMFDKHGAKSSVVAQVKELRVPSPLPPSEVAMKAAKAHVPPALMFPERTDSSLDFETFNPDDSDLVPVVHHQSVRKYPASFPEPMRREPTYDDVQPFHATDDLEPMRRIHTPQPAFAPYALVSESLMPQIIGVDIVTTPPPAPISWRHRLAMAAIWTLVISTGGGAIGYSRGDFTKQDVRFAAAQAQLTIEDIARVADAHVDHPRHQPRTWKK